MDTTPQGSPQGSPRLARSLGLWAIVALGLGYMTPTVMFDTFGIVHEETNGVVPTAYLVALVVMLFTAISYGRMVRVFPSAGSAYTYTRETMHPGLGFLVGWTALLDYLLLPLVNALILRLYMESVFPGVASWIWVVVFVAAITALNVWSINSTSRVNFALLVFEVVMVAAFVVLAVVDLNSGVGAGTVFTTDTFFHENVEAAAVLTGATVVCFSFIGFDAITMYTEEARDPSVMPKAIMVCLLIGGAIFLFSSHFAQAVFPDVSVFEITDDPLPEMALLVGGKIFQLLFLSAAFAATVASGLASHASVSRLLYVMGRNGVLMPARFFAWVHPKHHTPVGATLFVGAVSLLAITPSLELVASMINFGALVAFSFVNLAVIAHFAVRRRQLRNPREVATNLVLPLVGFGLTVLLWSFLHGDAFVMGLSWAAIGLVYAVVLKLRGRSIGDIELREEPPADRDDDPTHEYAG